MTLPDLLAKIRGVRKTARGWEGFCPAHDDGKRPALGVSVKDGKRLVHCMAGCANQAVADALGVTLAELLHDEPGADRPGTARRIAATYRYEDESGNLLFEVLRYDPKDFRPRRPDGKFTLDGVRRSLYRLPHLAEKRRIYFVEGEKDADRLASLGLAATTTQGGAKAWRKDYAAQMAGLAPEEVVLIPDNDEAGEEYVAAVGRDLVAAKLRVKVLRLAPLPPKGDVSDWLDGGGTAGALDALADEAPAMTAPGEAPRATVHWGTVIDELLDSYGKGVTLGLATPYGELNRYLSGGVQPGELVYLGAYPGVGKTALLLEFARGVATQGASALIFSREMVNLALTRRLLAQSVRVPAARLKDGRLGDADFAALTTSLPKLKGLPIWLNQVAASIDDIAAEVAGFAGAPPLGAVFVDYLQLIRGASRGREQSRRIEVEAASQGLKALALRHRIPVFCASSLSRGPQPDPGAERKPSINLLRESGELEHDADIILLLHRGFGKPETECRIAKNRDGRVGTARLLFREEFVAFDEPADREM